MSETGLIKTYGAVTRMLGPLTPLWIKKRTEAGKEDPERAAERHGVAGIPRPGGALIWCHGASVGECTMLLPVIDRILAAYPQASVLVTSGTLTSAEILDRRLPPRAYHQYVPLDYPKAVNTFLDHWRPDAVLWAESDIWPNLLRLTKKRGVPMVLLNARMSEKSIQTWHTKGAKSGRALFGLFDKILAADERTAKGLGLLLETHIEAVGNLKLAAPALPVDEAELKAVRTQTSRRKIWCAASTHSGEDEMMIAAHQKLLARYPKSLLILAPRHPERREDIKALLDAAGLSYVTRTSGADVDREAQVWLFDTIGEMGLALRLSQICFVCGSLVDGLSGHNPLEPARLGNAVMTGPHISSFADTYMSMIAFDAARRVLSPDPIGDMLVQMFSDPNSLKKSQETAQTYADGRDAVLSYVWKQITPILTGAIS